MVKPELTLPELLLLLKIEDGSFSDGSFPSVWLGDEAELEIAEALVRRGLLEKRLGLITIDYFITPKGSSEIK